MNRFWSPLRLTFQSFSQIKIYQKSVRFTRTTDRQTMVNYSSTTIGRFCLFRNVTRSLTSLNRHLRLLCVVWVSLIKPKEKYQNLSTITLFSPILTFAQNIDHSYSKFNPNVESPKNAAKPQKRNSAKILRKV